MDIGRPFVTAAAAVCLALLPPAPSGAAVYRCTNGDTPPHFSQFPCGNGETVIIDPADTVSIPPISDAEQSLLDELERQHREEAEARTRARRRAAREARSLRREQRERCRAALDALERLERERRKGYSLGEARALERREEALDEQRRRNC